MNPQPDTEELNRIFIQACELHSEGDYRGAEKLYRQLLGYADAPILRYNLGLVCYDLRNLPEAKRQLEKCLSMQPDDADALFNLAIVQKQLGDLHAAVQTYTTLIQQHESQADALYNLGGCYRELDQPAKAAEYYRKVLAIDPDHASAANNLAFCLQVCGDNEGALNFYKRVLELKPDHASAKHMAAALEGRSTESPPDEYIREVFDNYSEKYDDSLVHKLSYSVPEKLLALLEHLSSDRVKTTYLKGADLGCGTGLSGVPFHNRIEFFHGIDLSQKMIDIAAQKGIYSTLSAGNISEILRSEAAKNFYDFFLAADVLTYMGELTSLFSDIRSCATENALFLFSTEWHDKDSFVLRPSGRYAHSEEYIRTTLATQGWRVLACKQANLRKERGTWIAGQLWAACR